MIPQNGWKSMESAPRDGSVFMVKYREYGKKDGPEHIQACQYLCDENGGDWRWRKPWHTGTTVHADGWMTVAELVKACEREFAAGTTVEPATRVPEGAGSSEYDL